MGKRKGTRITGAE